MMVLFGEYPDDTEKVKTLLQQSLAGEMSVEM